MRRPIRTTTLALLIALATANNSARADELVAAPPTPMEGGVPVELIDPAAVDPRPDGVTRTTIGNQPALVITGNPAETSRRIIEVNAPALRGARYLVKGWVRYDNVAGDAYLEMWNYFDGGAYFSRTLGDAGPMAKLTGTSGWRVFLLPFNPTSGEHPNRLEVNVVLPGAGTVTITDVRLVDFGANDAAASQPAPSVAPPLLPGPPASGPPLAQPSWLNFAAAGAGLATMLVLALVVGVIVLATRRRRFQQTLASELDRIRALDTAI